MFDGPARDIQDALSQFGWDSSVLLIELKRKDIISILERYINSDLSVSDVEDWANAIEGRDDIGFEKNCKDLLIATIHILANPLLTRPLDYKLAYELIALLQKK